MGEVVKEAQREVTRACFPDGTKCLKDENNFKVEVNCPVGGDDEPRVPSRLGRLLLSEMMLNAAQYSSPDQCSYLTIRVDGDQMAVSVSGGLKRHMPASSAMAQQQWMRGTTTKSNSQFGVGLSLANRIAHWLGG